MSKTREPFKFSRFCKLLICFTAILWTARVALFIVEINQSSAATALNGKRAPSGEAIVERLSKIYPRSTNRKNQERVGRVGIRLLEAAHMPEKQDWKVVLFDSNLVNAVSAPGNWILVWNGLLKFAENDDELAAVLAHEIGHTLSHHLHETNGERFVKDFSPIYSYGESTLSRIAYMTSNYLTNVVKSYFVEPERQRREYEADARGLFLMAEAGYDPRAAVEIMKRYAKSANDKTGETEFQSHPATLIRIEKLEALLPSAIARYQASELK